MTVVPRHTNANFTLYLLLERVDSKAGDTPVSVREEFSARDNVVFIVRSSLLFTCRKAHGLQIQVRILSCFFRNMLTLFSFAYDRRPKIYGNVVSYDTLVDSCTKRAPDRHNSVVSSPQTTFVVWCLNVGLRGPLG